VHTGRGSHLPDSSSIHRNATRSLAYAVGLGIGWGRSNSTEAKRDTWRKTLNGAHARGVAWVVDIADDLPAASSTTSRLIPHVYMETVWGVKAEVNEHPGIGKVRGSLQLGLVDGTVQVSGVTGDAQGAPHLIEAGYGQRGDDERDHHDDEQFESGEASSPSLFRLA